MMYFIATKLEEDPTTEEGKVKYEDFINAVTSLGAWSDRLGQTWLVESKLSASRIRSLLKPHLSNKERVFVGQFSQNWAGFNMGPNFPKWIKRRDFDIPGTKK